MSFDADEEILQDFLVEAGEILELLSEQLVDLENRPDDADLLNAIFRGFHTVKGGAGFLQLDTLVDLCHAAENIFDLLRNHKLSLNAELMDTFLQALDSVNSMFAQVHARQYPDAADPALMDALHAILEGGSPAVAAIPDADTAESVVSEGDITDEEFEQFLDALDEEKSKPVETPSAAGTGAGDEITDDEFEALLDQLHGKGKFGGPAVASKEKSEADTAVAASDSISDDEFEKLLDDLHGKGKHGGVPAAESGKPKAKAKSKTAAKASPKTAAKKSASTAAAAPKTGATSSDEITDDEFESILDQMHGKGKGPTAAHSPKPAKVAPDATPEAKSEPVAKAAVASGEKKPVARPPAGKESAPAAENTVRVDTKRLDEIMNMVGELVLVRNRLVRLGLRTADEDLSKAVANLDVVTGDLQTAVMKTRMQPIKKVFGRFPRVVRDLARNLKKEISLELEGEETDLDKNLVEALADPLVHLVRNSVDHGIEAPDVREMMGKPRMGKVVLSAEQEGDHIVLSITDDGGGMDPDMLRKKAIDKGLMDEEAAARLDDTEAFNLIFHPGFSTKDQISDVSGRGVGMDVVKTKISQLNGTIEVHSEKGVGSRIAIKVPLTLAIMPTLMVMLGKQAFALPLVNVNEIFNLDLSRTNVVDGQEVVVVRQKALPLFHLKRWLIHGVESENQQAHVVIVSVGTQKVGFVVDQLIGQEEVVIKPLGKMLNGTPGMAGATITGDGRIALILDIPSMLKAYAQRV
ncbi:chemotaxis protein CheA [Ketobacter sp. MCCC 1A13808]|uniref:chemotaxis protein CheA n=1 Tax=Ketobacter sp. MCCC 1A13808 TaxID=2602738 RepID=UPI000F0E310F|nr:chemotaxis protein CheA [Ketobacter sp. MCCC 1A13808]MVF10896.1 chemotaxis protein CheA [Ketobacter sp. MCCC 1A13808]RLP56289.1 MAG: chemotaxis protein CheA [Ketobacter sp.]